MTHPSRAPSDHKLLDHLRAVCLEPPQVEERLNHGMPAFGIPGRAAFAKLHGHPEDGRPTLWFKAGPGVQEELIEEEPDRFFVPPYVGPQGWVGLRLYVDLDWAGVVGEAWRMTAPKRLAAEWGGV